jgi:hypothetical protein
VVVESVFLDEEPEELELQEEMSRTNGTRHRSKRLNFITGAF